MYQGKFDAKSKGQNAPGQALDDIIREREEANAAKAARKAQRDAAKRTAPRPTQAEAPKRTADPTQPEAAARKPQRSASPTPGQRPNVQRTGLTPEQRAARATQNTQQGTQQRPAKASQTPRKQTQNEVVLKKRGPRTGGMIFYTFYFALIFVFFIGVFIGLNWLNGWLKDYEAAQPTVKCQQVFDQLFANPDWGQLYQLAGDPTGTGTNKYDTQFEGKDQYVKYMTEKVGNQALEYVETSGGLSGKKYIVRLGNEKLATFTLSGQSEKITDIPDWELGEVELFINREQTIQIRLLENHVAYINNSPLSDDYTIQKAYTKADEKQLPENRITTTVQEVTGLLTTPDLLVYDQTGAPIEVQYNSDSGMFEEQISSIAMSEEERTAVFGALEAYAGFMINASGSRASVAKYFDGSSQAYNDILKMNSELWMNSDKGHSFENEEILGYTKHSDTLFSVRASIVMRTTIKDLENGGTTETTYDVTQSMYFTYKNGKWLCTEMTNEDITVPVGEVRLTFCDNAGNVLSTGFYSTSVQSITTPDVQTPAGKVFAGWCTVETNAEGQKTWNVVFQPDETNTVTLTSDYNLTPMKLYPLFQNA